MIDGKSVLAIIPARGGSKGVPRKNIREVAGKPLLAWTVEEARKSRYIDRLVLSSEDDEIIRVARQCGCEVPFVRPAELSRDDTPGIDPVLHAIASLPGYDYLVLLQPTSPLRGSGDIDGSIALCVESGADSCVSVVEADKHPYWMFTVSPGGSMRPFIEAEQPVSRRQDLPEVYSLNGAVYVAKTAAVVSQRSFVTDRTVPYVMDKISSIDIDTEADLVIAETLLSRGDISRLKANGNPCCGN